MTNINIDDRIPYVGSGPDGCLRSAEIDRDEAAHHNPGTDRDRCLASADAWEAQAGRMAPDATPTFAQLICSSAPSHDVAVIDTGTLVEPMHGRPAGTPFVVIETETYMGRRMARQYLGRYCSNNDLSWEEGWWERPPRPLPQHGTISEALSLVIYPSNDYSRVHAE